jgi:hypothetical protein
MQELLIHSWENLFRPFILFFYLGFAVPLLGVPFEFPRELYLGATIYLLIATGWRGGEALAELEPNAVGDVVGFMVLGFAVNLCLGLVAYTFLRRTRPLRQIDAVAVAGSYGSDSIGTFLIAVGALAALQIEFAAYMPVMLAVMELPGCLLALLLVARMRRRGMDAAGVMPGETGHSPINGEPGSEGGAIAASPANPSKRWMWTSTVRELAYDLFCNPGIFLLCASIGIGFVSRCQGASVTSANDMLFQQLFQGVLCLFLLEAGLTACRELRQLRRIRTSFILFALIFPNIAAVIGIFAALGFAAITGTPLALGTVILFGVLCSTASYVAIPAVLRLAVPGFVPVFPIAAALGVTFPYNVSFGIPLYCQIAKLMMGASGQ